MNRHVPALGVVGVLALIGCASAGEPAPITSGSASPPSPATEPAPVAPLRPSGAGTVIARDLDAPWSVVRLENGSTLVSERDSGRIVEVTADGGHREVERLADAVHEGESGLLGLAVDPADQSALFAYLTTATDNRIVRMPLGGAPGAVTLGEPTVILDGLPRARNHDGGRLAFGPDGLLYATVGDAGVPGRARDLDSPGGKILRMTPAGDVPDGNPFPESLVYSLGHRNPQGLAWGADGTMYAAEFGQDTWDELNVIEPGGDYGWPIVEGEGSADGFIDPIAQWPTDEASPSGLTQIGETLFLAGLGGERLWTIEPDGTTAEWFAPGSGGAEFGRLRDVLPGPDGTLWLLTNETDGRGTPQDGDDRIIEVVLED